MRVIDDILQMLSTVGAGRTRDDAVMAMASAYRSYAHHHPGRYSAFTRMPLGGDDPEFTSASHAAAAPVIDVGLPRTRRPGRVLCGAGVLGGVARVRPAGDDRSDGFRRDGAAMVDPDAVFSDMVLRLAAGMAHRDGQAGSA